jgi:dTMP kinase
MSQILPSQGAPVFIALEGIDGSGTTTQLERVASRLRARGRRVLATREPSPGPIGRLLREILLGQHGHADGSAVDGRTMALLFAADRRDHLAREVEPALAAGLDVVTDRYLLSSLAYQAVEADRAWVEALADGLRQPDLTVLLDVDIRVAAARRLAAGREIERYDADGFLARVVENYRRLAASRPNVVRLDGSRSIEDVDQAIGAAIDALLITAPAR